MPTSPPWLALSAQLPTKPAYARVKLWRRLRDAGAVLLPGGLYLLPNEEPHRKALQTAADDVAAGGGSATLIAGMVLGDDAKAHFHAARRADYAKWCEEARLLAMHETRSSDVARMRRRLGRIRAIDFFGSEDRSRTDQAHAALVAASQRHPDVHREAPGTPFRARELHGRVWVTRRDLGIDRIASAWLIRRHIDPRPRFRFVSPDRYVHQRRELRFDMADGEFTHEGSDCTFETLLRRADVDASDGLIEIARIIHQLDIEDGLYDRPAAARLAAALAEICASHPRDEDRIAAAMPLFDGLEVQASGSSRAQDRADS